VAVHDNGDIGAKESTVQRAIDCMILGFWLMSKSTSSWLAPSIMLPSTVWAIVVIGVDRTGSVRSVIRI